MQMNIELHKYATTDKSYIWEVYVNSMKSYVERIWGWDDTLQNNIFEKNFGKYETNIIKQGQSKIGYTQFDRGLEHTHIGMLALTEDYRSKGLGEKVLSILQSQSTNNILRLNCFKINTSAYKFYIKCGFNVFNEDENFISLLRVGND